MLLTKDGLIKSQREVRALYPETSFSVDETFASLGWSLYVRPPPTQAEIDADAARGAEMTADNAATTTAKTDPVIQYLRDHTPAEVEAYIQANVTDATSTRQMLKKFGVVLCILAKRNLR
jgi:hypothetical protein